MSNPQAGGLDLDAIARQLVQHGHNDMCELRVLGPPASVESDSYSPICTCGHEGALALVEEVRALRTALRPFVTGLRAEEVLEAAALAQWDNRLGLPVQYAEHVETALTVGDLRRAAEALGVAPERDESVPGGTPQL